MALLLTFLCLVMGAQSIELNFLSMPPTDDTPAVQSDVLAEVVEIVRWRQPICVSPASNVTPCALDLQRHQAEYERVNDRSFQDATEVKRIRKTLNGAAVRTSIRFEDLEPSSFLESSQEIRDKVAETPSLDRHRRFFAPRVEARNGQSSPPPIYVTKVLNSPVTATLVAQNCFPDIGVPVCDDYQDQVRVGFSQHRNLPTKVRLTIPDQARHLHSIDAQAADVETPVAEALAAEKDTQTADGEASETRAAETVTADVETVQTQEVSAEPRAADADMTTDGETASETATAIDEKSEAEASSEVLAAETTSNDSNGKDSQTEVVAEERAAEITSDEANGEESQAEVLTEARAAGNVEPCVDAECEPSLYTLDAGKQRIIGKIDKLFEKKENAINGLMEGTTHAVQSIVSGVEKTKGSIIRGFVNKTQTVAQSIVDTKQNIIKEIDDGRQQIFNKITQKTDNVVQAIVNAAVQKQNTVKEVVHNLEHAKQNVVEGIQHKKESIIESIGHHKDNLVHGIVAAKDTVINGIVTTKDAVIHGIEHKKQSIVDGYNGMIDKKNQVIQSLVENTQAIVKNIIDKTTEINENIAQKKQNFVQSIADKQQSIIDGIATTKQNVIQHIADHKASVIKSISDGTQQIIGTVSLVKPLVLGQLENKLGIAEPPCPNRPCLNDPVQPELVQEQKSTSEGSESVPVIYARNNENVEKLPVPMEMSTSDLAQEEDAEARSFDKLIKLFPKPAIFNGLFGHGSSSTSADASTEASAVAEAEAVAGVSADAKTNTDESGGFTEVESQPSKTPAISNGNFTLQEIDQTGWSQQPAGRPTISLPPLTNFTLHEIDEGHRAPNVARSDASTPTADDEDQQPAAPQNFAVEVSKQQEPVDELEADEKVVEAEKSAGNARAASEVADGVEATEEVHNA